jgi:hypothetical protein
MDTTKPYGDACTPNSGLKEAHEITWVNDPDDDCSMPNGESAVIIKEVQILTLIRKDLPALTV